MLWIPNQQELAYVGQDVILACHIEAYPKSINYWTTAKGDMIISGEWTFLKSNIFFTEIIKTEIFYNRWQVWSRFFRRFLQSLYET